MERICFVIIRMCFLGKIFIFVSEASQGCLV